MHKKLVILLTVLMVSGVFSVIGIAGAGHSNGYYVGSQIQGYAPMSSIGTSKISLNTTSVTVAQDSSVQISYSVKLVNGTTWGTSISASSISGLSVSFSTGSGDPTFNGIATISPSLSVKPALYVVKFTASGDDPSPSVSINVTVVNKTSSSTPPPIKAPSVNDDPFIAGGIVMALFVVTLGITALIGGAGTRYLNIGSVVVALGSSIYLIAYDNVMRTQAYSHWLGLIAYVVLVIIAMLIPMASKKIKKTSMYGLFIGSTLLGILMIADALIGLPASNYYATSGNIGWNYLFGFGTTSISTFAISTAFSLLLVMVGIVAGTSVYLARHADKK